MNDNGGRHRPAGKTRLAISNYLLDRDDRQMVSTSDAIAYLRGRFPLLATSDRLLADVVAGQAIILGLEVELDAESNDALFDRWPREAANNNGAG
jgi:hypothetical protein